MADGGKKGGKRGRLGRAAKSLRKARSGKPRSREWAGALDNEDLDAAHTREERMRRSREDMPSEIVRDLAEGSEAGTFDIGDPEVKAARVVGVRRRSCRALLEGEEIELRIPTDIAMFQRMVLAVGDWVAVGEGDSGYVVAGVAARASKLSRPDPHIHGMERVVAANIDAVVIVASVVQPEFSPGAVDRYLIAAQAGAAEPMLCVNKTDAAEPPAELVDLYRDMAMPVFLTSCADGRGVDAVSEAIRGKTCVFVGHSGVGKSSLLNQLDPTLNARVGVVREADGRGRHTTTFCCLYRLACGAEVIDTPGVREIGLWRMSPEDLPFYFPEFHDLPPCRFRDCAHTHEPGCAVKDAVETGAVARPRYESYVRILGSLKGA